MKHFIIIALIALAGCKKSNINPSTDIVGNWQITSYESNGHTFVYSPARPVEFQKDGIYTVNSARHSYEIVGDKIKLDRRYLYDFDITGSSLAIHGYIENPVTPQSNSVTNMSKD